MRHVSRKLRDRLHLHPINPLRQNRAVRCTRRWPANSPDLNPIENSEHRAQRRTGSLRVKLLTHGWIIMRPRLLSRRQRARKIKHKKNAVATANDCGQRRCLELNPKPVGLHNSGPVHLCPSFKLYPYLKVHLCSTSHHTYDFPIKISQQLKGVETKVAPQRATQNRVRNRLRGSRGSRNHSFTMNSRLKVASKKSVRLIIIHSLF